jgi:hypothetical protein
MSRKGMYRPTEDSIKQMKAISFSNNNSALKFMPVTISPYQRNINYTDTDLAEIYEYHKNFNLLNKEKYSLQQEIINGTLYYGSVHKIEARIESIEHEINTNISEINKINNKYNHTDYCLFLMQKYDEIHYDDLKNEIHNDSLENENPDKININDNLSSTEISIDQKIEILKKYLQENPIKNKKMENQSYKLPSINITENPSVEVFFANLKKDNEEVISFSKERETVFDIFLKFLKLTKKQYKEYIDKMKKIATPTDELFSNKEYDKIDPSKISQRDLFKKRHAFSNTTRDGKTLSEDPERIKLAERYDLNKKIRKISKSTGIDHMIQLLNSLNITSANVSESYSEYVNSVCDEFKKGIQEKILSSPEYIQVFVKISNNNRPIGKVSGITSSDKSAAILSLMANNMKINIFSNSNDKSIDSTKLFSDNFNDITNFIMDHNDNIVTQIDSYISREIIKLQELMKTDEINSYHFPPFVIFTDINIDIESQKINDFINQLSIVLLEKEISISPPFFVIYNLGENQIKSNENILQWSGWSEIEYITILKKIHDRDTKKLDIIKNDEIKISEIDSLNSSVNNKETDVDDRLYIILNNPTSKMIEDTLLNA